MARRTLQSWALAGFLSLALLTRGPAACAQGLVLAPASQPRQPLLREQVAVLSVGADHTVRTDLFLGLESPARAPQEVTLLLPLQSVPRGLTTREVTLDEFCSAHVDALEEVPADEAKWREEIRRGLRTDYVIASILAGPSAFAAALLNKVRRERTVVHAYSRDEYAADWRLAGRRGTAMACTAAEVRPALFSGRVGGRELPDRTRQEVMRHAGRPAILLQLRLTPPKGPPSGPKVFRDWQGFLAAVNPRRSRVPGLQVSFEQLMAPEGNGGGYRYDLPLSTSQAWAGPLSWANIYVTAPGNLSVQARFPAPTVKQKVGPTREAGVAGGRQVLLVHYHEAKFAQDAEIRLGASGRSEVVAARDGLQRRARIGPVAFPLAALLAWLLAYRLCLPWGRGVGLRRRLRAMVDTWVVGQALLLLPMLSLFCVLAMFVFSGTPLGVLLALPAITSMAIWIFEVGSMLQALQFPVDGRQWRVVLAAMVSGAIYVAVGLIFGVF